jgi:hypothetical protein
MCRPCLNTAHVYKDDVILNLEVRYLCCAEHGLAEEEGKGGENCSIKSCHITLYFDRSFSTHSSGQAVWDLSFLQVFISVVQIYVREILSKSRIK